MNTTVEIGARLTIICGVAALVLGVVNAMTAPVIQNRRLEDEQRLVQALAGTGRVGRPQAVEGNPAVRTLWVVTDSQGRPGGYVLRLTGEGYGGGMAVLAGFSPAGEIRAVRLFENQETPGLGKKAEEAGYAEKFLGTGAGRPVPLRKSQLSSQEAEAVTGSTITFMGISRALAAGAEFIKSPAARSLGGGQ